MRERQRLIINRQTGAVTVDTEIVDDDADVAQRIRELAASVPDIGHIESRTLAVECDGCGAVAGMDVDKPRMPGGWVSCDAGEFCPRCHALS